MGRGNELKWSQEWNDEDEGLQEQRIAEGILDEREWNENQWEGESDSKIEGN